VAWDLQKLFQRHALDISRALRKRGHNAETAADLTQDTFLRVLAAAPAEGTANHNPKAYLYQVSRNLSVNHFKRHRLTATVDLGDEALAQIPDSSPTPETVVYDRQRLRQTAEALEELPERTRVAFELHRLNDLTIAEVAGRLGLSTTRTWALIREAYRHIVIRTGTDA
jgi:RNA polymerase sigma-70 factor (ECF subfamily)